MLKAARALALVLIVALLYVPAVARAQQRLESTGGALLSKFSHGAEGTREKVAGVAILTAVVVAVARVTPARTLAVVRPRPPIESDQNPPDALRAPPVR